MGRILRQQVSTLGHLSCIILLCVWVGPVNTMRWSQAIDFSLCQRWWVVSPVITLCYRRLRFSCWWKEQPPWAREPGRRGNFRASWRWQPARQGSQLQQGAVPLASSGFISPALGPATFFNTPNSCLCSEVASGSLFLRDLGPGPWTVLSPHQSSYASISPLTPTCRDLLGAGSLFLSLHSSWPSLGSCSLSKAFHFRLRKSPQPLAQVTCSGEPPRILGGEGAAGRGWGWAGQGTMLLAPGAPPDKSDFCLLALPVTRPSLGETPGARGPTPPHCTTPRLPGCWSTPSLRF